MKPADTFESPRLHFALLAESELRRMPYVAENHSCLDIASLEHKIQL
jgi:hypothetical protein